jgi:eukaryotic-like serine/threonine-protein kinase
VEHGRRDERGFSSSWGPGRQPLRVFEGGIDGATSATSVPSLLAQGLSPLSGPTRTIGRYALHGEIAAGGMAAVHIGRLLGPVGFARTVAIKRLHPPLAKDPEFVAMFLDEARLAARIRHPNVVSTLDIVATEGELFVVMDHVQGESLARLMRVARTLQQPVPVPIVAAIMVGVLHGLHAAHEARDEQGEPLRIVHRDVSPHNVLVGIDGAAHLIDFGIAKARGRIQVTRDGQIKGKLSYMPPEQLLGQGLDHRADIFAAAIVFWEAITGRRLFEGIDDGDIYARVLHGEVEPPSVHVPGLGTAVDSIVLRGLARDRTSRYPTAREMALAIEAVMPLAPPSRVGAWVESLAGEALTERMEQIADIEGGTGATEKGDSTPSSILAARPDGMRSDARRDGRPKSLPPGERTGPTRPDDARLSALTRIENGGRLRQTASHAVEAGAPDDSLAAVAGVPQGSSRRIVLLATTIIIGLVVFGAFRLRARPWQSAAPAPPVTVEAHPVTTRTGSTAPLTSPKSSEPPTFSVQSLPAAPPVDDSAQAGAQPASRPPRAQKAVTSPPPVQPRPRLSPAPSEEAIPEATTPVTPSPAATAPSCDPPYWFDADGNKRYYRHCVGH